MQGRFVIQEHQGRTHHFDLRLEKCGVFKSWAVPKGVPVAPGEKHLAIAVADHPLEYGEFEGTIPAGEYGAGQVRIWDHGSFDAYVWTPDRIVFRFKGTRLGGRYALVRFPHAGDHHWLLFKFGN